MKVYLNGDSLSSVRILTATWARNIWMFTFVGAE